jgi:exodeoxyribonuclease-3
MNTCCSTRRSVRGCGWISGPSRAGCITNRPGERRFGTGTRGFLTVDDQTNRPTPFTLIAVWACAVGAKRADRYIGQVYQALIAQPEWFIGNPVVLAGDLNSNRIWDAHRLVGNHSDVVKFLDERGLVSVYHEHFGEPQGEETRRTMYLFRHEDKPFHIDYIFIPREWAARLNAVEVRRYEQWSKL